MFGRVGTVARSSLRDGTSSILISAFSLLPLFMLLVGLEGTPFQPFQPFHCSVVTTKIQLGYGVQGDTHVLDPVTLDFLETALRKHLSKRN